MRIISAICKRINWDWLGVQCFYAKHFMKQPTVLSVHETLELIIKEHYSISRNGDGELNIMMGRDIPFQRKNERLANILIEAHRAEIPRYISGLPNVFDGYNHLGPKAQLYFRNFLHANRYCWYKLATASRYADANVTRFYLNHIDKEQSKWQITRLQQIWEDQKVILVGGEMSRLGVGNDLFARAKSVRRVIGPAENAFDVYDKLMDCVKQNASKDDLIMLALGPTATAMAYELAKAGYWAVDIGHIDIEYEWYLMGATTKVNIPGKYTNESTGEKVVGALPKEVLDKYNNEIVAKFL